MAVDPSAFWDANHYKHPRLTDRMLSDAERVLGVKLPVELVALLRVQNGGYTKGFAHPMGVPTTWAEDHVPLSDLNGIVTDPDHDTPMSMVHPPRLTREWGLPEKQVLLSGDGHYWITLDYRRGANPSVAWIDVECDEDLQIAPTFAAFLDGLEPSQKYDAA